jgi:serine protease Do
MKIIKTIKQLLFFYTIVHLTGCTLIFLPKNQKVAIRTQQPNSKVYVNNEEVGEGQTVVAKVKKDGAKQVVVQTPGYKDGYNVLMLGKRNPAFWPLMLLDAPFIYPLVLIDAQPVPKFYRFSKINDLPASYKYAAKAANEKFVHLEAIKLDIANKDKDLQDYFGIAYSANSAKVMQEIEKAENARFKQEQKLEAKNAKKKKKKKSLLTEDKRLNYDNTVFSERVFKTLKRTGYVDTINKVFADNNNTVVLEGIIKKASVFQVVGSGGSNYKKAKVNVIWNIKNTFGEQLDSINSWSFSGDFVVKLNDKGENDNADKMFADAIDNSYLDLSKDPRFVKHLAIETNLGIGDPVLSIKMPKTRVQDVSEASTATVTVKQEGGGHGSGFAITNDGYILTNFHVVAGETFGKLEKLTVILSDGEEVPATVVRYNRMRDIALLKVNKKFDKAFNLSDSKSFKNLMEVYSIGTPKSIELGQSVSLGLISNERKSNNNNLLQVSININAGNSGGPLFEKNGTLQGVVTSKLVGFSTEGVGFAIPSYLIPAYLNLSLN